MRPTLYETVRYFLHYDPIAGAFTRRATGGVGSFLNKKSGYMIVSLLGKQYMAHRVAFVYMTGRLPKNFIDHINGIRSDNTWSNLREVTQIENNQNNKLNKNSTTGVTGVSWDTHWNKWSSYVNFKGKRKNLGLYENFVDAVNARLAAEKELGFHPNHGRVELKENADGTGR